MKCLAVCQDELLIRTLHQVLAPTFPVEFLVENRTLGRRLHDNGLPIALADPKRCDAFLKVDLSPSDCVIIQDTHRKGLGRVIEAARDAGGTLIYVLGTRPDPEREAELKDQFPDVTYLTLAELVSPALTVALSRSLTRARVQQYQRYFEDADRVLILLHNDPDPDAMASGLALRTLLRRNKTTAIIGAVQNVTRPENIRMKHLLDLQVETVSSADFANFDRIATVDVQPHYFGGALERCDLVVDHHPEQANHNAVFKDIRPDYGSTCTILTEHLRAVDMDISERVATAMLYAIKSDTLFFARQTNRVDLDAFSHLYPLADAALIRKMEGADLSLDRLEYVTRAVRDGTLADQVFTAFLGKVPREDCITYAADFFLDLEDVRWTVISGVVNEMMIISVRNLGYSRNAGDFVKKAFGDIGSAGGHRAMAKAVVPIHRFAEKFGAIDPVRLGTLIRSLVAQFLHDAAAEKKKEPVGAKASSAANAATATTRPAARRRDMRRPGRGQSSEARRSAIDGASRGRRAGVGPGAAARRPRGFGPLQLVAARPQHRVDELTLGVLGPELDQLTQRLPAIRALVVGAVGVEQADGVVRRLDLVDAGEAIEQRGQRVARRRRLGTGEVLRQPRPRFHGARAQRVRAIDGDVGRDHDHLLGAGRRHLLEQPHDGRRAIADAVRLAAPEAGRVEAHHVRLRQPGHRQRAGDRVDDVSAAVARQVHDFGPALILGAAAEEARPRVLAEQREDQVAS